MLRNRTKEFKEKYQSQYDKTFKQLYSTFKSTQKNNMAATASECLTSKNRQSIKKLETNFHSKKNLLQHKSEQLTEASDKKVQRFTLPYDNGRKLLIAQQPIIKNPQIRNSFPCFHQTFIKSIIKKQRDPKQFIQNLGKNQLFYCCECFAYYFQIQKTWHYPQCQCKLNTNSMERQEIVSQGWRKLKNIYQLSKYTKTKIIEIEKIYGEMKRNEFNLVQKIEISMQNRFFTLQEIVEAFAFTYDRLLRGAMFLESGIATCF